MTKIQNCQVITLVYSSELLVWRTDDHCIEQVFCFDVCLRVVSRVSEVRALRSRPAEEFVSENVVVTLYFRLRFGLGFRMACGVGKTLCSTVDHKNVSNSGKIDLLLIKLTLFSRTRSKRLLLGTPTLQWS